VAGNFDINVAQVVLARALDSDGGWFVLRHAVVLNPQP